MMHVGLGRRHPLHIEYVHLGACLGFIQDIMTEAILSHPRMHLSRKTALVKALNKVIWIQNDLMAKWHVRDGVEFEAVGGASDIEVEREGYLHGKKILGGSGSDEDDEANEEKQQQQRQQGEEGERAKNASGGVGARGERTRGRLSVYGPGGLLVVGGGAGGQGDQERRGRGGGSWASDGVERGGQGTGAGRLGGSDA